MSEQRSKNVGFRGSIEQNKLNKNRCVRLVTCPGGRLLVASCSTTHLALMALISSSIHRVRFKINWNTAVFCTHARSFRNSRVDSKKGETPLTSLVSCMMQKNDRRESERLKRQIIVVFRNILNTATNLTRCINSTF